MVEVQLNVTPQKKISKDHTNTPISGSINGSCVKKYDCISTKYNQKHEKSLKNSQQHSSDDNSQTIQVMKNMQTVLETVLFELHLSKKHNLRFKQDVSSQLHEISSQQQHFVESFTAISENLHVEVNKCITGSHNSNSLATEVPSSEYTKSIGEIQVGINTLQKNISSRFDTFKSSLQTMETACTDLKRDTNARSITHKRQFDEIQTLSQKVFETVSDARYENKRTRENIIEMERSINVFSAAGEFGLVTQSRKENKQKESKTIPGQSSTEIILSDTEEEDTEITFAKVVITNTASSSEESNARNTSNSS